jgi:Ca-activated chloride channel homolog
MVLKFRHTLFICFTLLVCVVASWQQRADWYWQDLLFSRDQQGQWFFKQGDYRQAALRFDNPDWKATAFYAAEEFQSAINLWAEMPSAMAHFKRANALAHIEDYDAAADGYRLAIRLQPDRLAAKKNLELVIALGTKPKPVDISEGQKATEIGADEIVFSNDKNRMDKAEDEVEIEEGGLSSDAINDLWMRRLQSSPADFLRLKFRYQSEMGEQSGGAEVLDGAVLDVTVLNKVTP